MTVTWSASRPDMIRVGLDSQTALDLSRGDAVALRDALTDALAISAPGEAT